MGPYSFEELGSQNIDRLTWIWYEGLEKWTQLQNIDELRELFSKIPPPVKPGYNSGNYQNSNTTSSSAGYSTSPEERPGVPPKSWLTESILVTLLCCLPFGIVGIVNASKVESRYLAGDTDGAYRASSEAKKWTTLGFWVGIVAIIIYVIFVVVAADNVSRSYY